MYRDQKNYISSLAVYFDMISCFKKLMYVYWDMQLRPAPELTLPRGGILALAGWRRGVNFPSILAGTVLNRYAFKSFQNFSYQEIY